MQIVVEVLGGALLVALVLRGGVGFATDFGLIKKDDKTNG